MKNITPQKMSLLLLIAAVGFALLSLSAYRQSELEMLCFWLTNFALLFRALAEWRRPAGQSLRAFGGAVLLFVAFGFIMPAWAKLRGSPTGLQNLLMVPLFLNLLMPLLKLVVGRFPRSPQ